MQINASLSKVCVRAIKKEIYYALKKLILTILCTSLDLADFSCPVLFFLFAKLQLPNAFFSDRSNNCILYCVIK